MGPQPLALGYWPEVHSRQEQTADSFRFAGNALCSGWIRPMETDFYILQRARTPTAFVSLVARLLLLVSSSGCAILDRHNDWDAPTPFAADYKFGAANAPLIAAEAHFAAGQQAEEAGSLTCIEHYFSAAALAWPYQATSAMAMDDPATKLYRSAVRSFVDSAARFGRLDRRQGVVLPSGRLVPVSYAGFVWQPEDFCTFIPVGSYDSHRLSNRYVSAGVGAPFVVRSTKPARHPFTNNAQAFAATAVIAPIVPNRGFSLQFYDPLRTSASAGGLPLARDLTAPIAYAASRETDGWLDDFLRPNRGDESDGLHMHEPFQSGKIPVVFVHGLASDPLTWAQLENDLRAQPAIFSRYQFWFFRYDTGNPFLASAARLRHQLAAIRQTYDPARSDPNLSRMVIIGHSMGGLLAQMQVTYSGDTIWNAAAAQPLYTIRTDPATRQQLQASFFFEPSPDITRVIYIATPHSGSSDATRCMGRISSALIEEPPEWTERHAQLVRDNPGAFRDELRRKIPNSIDLLEPNSQILQATQRLPYRCGVTLHTILGDDEWTLRQGPSDGVVSVSSARLGGGQSELVVDAKHTDVQRVPETVREITCILNKHAGASP
jgi:pimeloyl-ACP methyl ester carboxylesterase